MIANEADDAASCSFRDPAFSNTKETHVEIVQVELLDPPITPQTLLVWLDQARLLGRRRAGERVVRRVAEHDQDRAFLLYPRRFVALLSKRWIGEAPALLRCIRVR